MAAIQQMLLGGGGKQITFLGTYSDYVDRLVYNFTGVNIGHGGLVIVAVGLDASGSAGLGGPTLSVGGISATRDTGGNAAGASNKTRSDIFSVVATGPTADIVVTPPRACRGCVIGVYVIHGLESTVVNSSTVDTGDTGSLNVLDLSVNTVANCAIIGCTASSSDEGTTWSGLTEDAEVTSGADFPAFSTAQAVGYLAESPRSISATHGNASVVRYFGVVAVYK